MFEVADQLISDRRRNPSPAGREDILDTMLNAADPVTGERLSDDNIRYQMVTFLVAGHETTSGLLSFALYELLRHPGVLAKARAPGGRGARRRERPRSSTCPSWATSTRSSRSRCGCGRRRRGSTSPRSRTRARRQLRGHRRDSQSWSCSRCCTATRRRGARTPGSSIRTGSPRTGPRTSPPTRGSPSATASAPASAGASRCRRRMLFLAMLLQRFEVTPADPGYQLKIKHTLTMKPEGLYIQVRRRDVTIAAGPRPPSETCPAGPEAPARPRQRRPGARALRFQRGHVPGLRPAHRQRRRRRGYSPSSAPLDERGRQTCPRTAVAIVTSSYEGSRRTTPASSSPGRGPARRATGRCPVRGLRQRQQGLGAHLPGGAEGHRRAPRRRAGATRSVERGEANARGDFFGDFDDWYAGFWAAVDAALGQNDQTPAARHCWRSSSSATSAIRSLRQNRLPLGTVVANRELVNLAKPGARSKRHIEIALPEG